MSDIRELTEQDLATLVDRFYERVRADPGLGPVFNAAIDDWPEHQRMLTAFWSSVALMTGRYHGTPMAAHVNLPVKRGHFDRWLALFRETAVEVCTAAGAAHVIDRAERIAQSLHMGIEDHKQFMTQWKALE